MYLLNYLLHIDEIYLFFILLLFSFTIINSTLKNKYNIAFKASLYTAYYAIILNLIYSLTIFYLVYNVVLNNSLASITGLDMFHYSWQNPENLTDLITKGILSFSVFIWFIIYYVNIKNKYTKKEHTNFEPVILYLLTTYLLLKLITSQDMFLLVTTLESQNLALCIICAYSVVDKGVSKIEAALKLYITSAASSGFLLLGSSIIYGVTGSIHFSEISLQLAMRAYEQVLFKLEDVLHGIKLIDTTNLNIYYSMIATPGNLSVILFTIGILCFFISIAFKIGQVPFHLWMADVYNGANTLFVSYLAIFPKIAIGYWFVKSIIYYFNCNFILLQLLFISGFLTIIIGLLGALYQKKIKSFIAYSSITNLGYLILLSSTANLINANLLIAICLLFIINYALVLLQIFISLISNYYMTNVNGINQVKEVTYLSELAGYWKINKINSLFLITSFLTLIGIPPLIGFIIKFYIVTFLVANNLVLVSWCFLILGVISTFYYLKIIKILIMDNVNKNLFLLNGDIKSKVIQMSIFVLQCVLFIKPLLFILIYIILF
jgi:NADH-quinone oxidoreductase subunit N